MTPTEKAIREFCGHHADWWPSTTQVQEMLALAQSEQQPIENKLLREENQRLRKPQETDCYGDGNVYRGVRSRDSERNTFKPDYNTEAVLVEEMQRMAKRIEGLETEQDCVGWFGYDTGLRLWFETNKGDDGAIPLYKARSAT